MAAGELLSTLAQLRTELAQTAEVDDRTRQELQLLIADIERRIAHPEGTRPPAARPEKSFSQQLLDVVTDFETRHPHLTATVSRAVDLLASMGI